MRPSFLLAALAVCISLTFQILLPVVPVMAERAGPHGIAGGATAALFIGAVAGELLTPWLMTRQRSVRLLVAGQLLTAVPSLVYALPHPAIWAMIAAASARGIGMGVAIVVSVALLAELATPERRGASIGYYGLALSVPGVFVPTIGVFLLANGRADLDAVIAFTSSLAGLLFALKIPDRSAQAAQTSSNLIVAIRRPGLFAVFAGFVLTSCSFGGVITIAPVALPLAGLGSSATFLFVAGAARALSRWLAGILGDRQPVRFVLLGGVAVSIAGLVGLALERGPGEVVLAALLYGTGYGATQTSAFLAMSERGAKTDSGAISALWNSGIDLGASLGGTVIGLAAAGYGYGAAAWILPAVAALSLPLFVRPAPTAAAPVPDAELYIR